MCGSEFVSWFIFLTLAILFGEFSHQNCIYSVGCAVVAGHSCSNAVHLTELCCLFLVFGRWFNGKPHWWKLYVDFLSEANGIRNDAFGLAFRTSLFTVHCSLATNLCGKCIQNSRRKRRRSFKWILNSSDFLQNLSPLSPYFPLHWISIKSFSIAPHSPHFIVVHSTDR